MAARFLSQYGLSEYDAGQLTQSKATAGYFEAVVTASRQPKLASNWVTGELSRRLNTEDRLIEDSPISPEQLAQIILRIADETISNNSGKQILEELWKSTSRLKAVRTQALAATLDDVTVSVSQEVVTADSIIEKLGLKQMSDSSELEKIIDDVLAANAKNVEEVRAGNTKAMNALVGQAMKATKGKANPAQVNELLKKKLG